MSLLAEQYKHVDDKYTVYVHWIQHVCKRYIYPTANKLPLSTTVFQCLLGSQTEDVHAGYRLWPKSGSVSRFGLKGGSNQQLVGRFRGMPPPPVNLEINGAFSCNVRAAWHEFKMLFWVSKI